MRKLLVSSFVLLLGLLGVYAAQAMEKPDSTLKFFVPFLTYIKNNTDTDWTFEAFVSGKPPITIVSIPIPPKSTSQIDQQIIISAADFLQRMAMGFMSLPLYVLRVGNKGRFDFMLLLPNKLVLSGFLDPKSIFEGPRSQISNELKVNTGDRFAIELNQDELGNFVAQLMLIKEKAAPGPPKEAEEEIRTLTYNEKEYTLNLKDDETFTSETFQELLEQGKELVAVVSNGYVHFYKKESFEEWHKKNPNDPITGKPVKEFFTIMIMVTDKEILKFDQ